MILQGDIWLRALRIDRLAKEKRTRLTRRHLQDSLEVTQAEAQHLLWALKNQETIQCPETVFETQKKVTVMADIHFPYPHKPSLSVALGRAEERKPDLIIILGDLIDFYKISKFNKRPTERRPYEEMMEARAFLEDLRSRFPDAQIIYKEGNHEERLDRYVSDKAPDVYELFVGAFEREMKLKELKIAYVRTRFRIGKLWLLHGHETPAKSPKYICNTMYQYIGDHFLVAHFHREDHKEFKNIRDEYYWGGAASCLCKDMEYAPLNQWTRGFTEIDFDRDGRFRAHNYKIVKGEIYT